MFIGHREKIVITLLSFCCPNKHSPAPHAPDCALGHAVPKQYTQLHNERREQLEEGNCTESMNRLGKYEGLYCYPGISVLIPLC